MNRTEELTLIAEQVSKCTQCNLHYSRKLAVPGEGPTNAEIMFIGEGPGFHENEQGRPFVGAAGKFLDELLASISMKRADVFIGNVVKCRPPSNRDPLPEELAAWMRERLHAAIFEELCNGIFTEETTDLYIEAILGLKARGAECVILGCT